MIAMLERIHNYIQQAHDEVILWKRWDIKKHSNEYYDAMSRMYPYTHKYYFEANPSFICDYKNILDMQRQPLIMLRDGVVNLASFFCEYHKPPAHFNSIILVHKRFARIVPEPWKEFVATYELDFPRADISSVDKVYIHGMLISYSFWLKNSKEILDELDKKIPKNTSVEFMLPIRERSFFVIRDETKYVTPFFEELYNRYGSSLKMHTNYDQLLNVKLKKGAAFCELTDVPFIFADNYMNHLFSHNDCSMIDPPKVDKENALIYPLSMNHNIVIKEIEKKNSDFNALFIRAKETRTPTDVRSEKFHLFIKDSIKNGLIKI